MCSYQDDQGQGYPLGCPGPRFLEESMEHAPTNEPIEGVVSIEGYTQSAGTGFKESLLLSVNPEAEFVDPDDGRETVLRLLDKIRAKVERDWELIVPAHDREA